MKALKGNIPAAMRYANQLRRRRTKTKKSMKHRILDHLKKKQRKAEKKVAEAIKRGASRSGIKKAIKEAQKAKDKVKKKTAHGVNPKHFIRIYPRPHGPSKAKVNAALKGVSKLKKQLKKKKGKTSGHKTARSKK